MVVPSNFMKKVYLILVPEAIKGEDPSQWYEVIYRATHFADNRNILYSLFKGTRGITAMFHLGFPAVKLLDLDNFANIRIPALPAGVHHYSVLKSLAQIANKIKILKYLPSIADLNAMMN